MTSISSGVVKAVSNAELNGEKTKLFELLLEMLVLLLFGMTGFCEKINPRNLFIVIVW